MMPFGMLFTPYDLLLIPAILLTLWAQARVKSAYARYAQVGVRAGFTGAQIARRIMLEAAVNDVDVEAVPGKMTDHYDPTKKVVRLSEGVYDGRSIAALGIAAHEVGHAIQHARSYAPMQVRSFIYPISSLGSNLAMPMIILGFLLTAFANISGAGVLITIGLWMFGASVAFTLVTLPVEFNASKRALQALSGGGYLDSEELSGARKVLNAAALTYVAAAAAAVLNLIRLLLIFGDQRD